MRYGWLLLGLQVGVASAGQVYVCTDDAGKKTFQSMPCSGGVKAEVREYAAPEPGGVAVTGESRLSTDNPIYKQMKADNRRRELEREIKKSERQIEKYRAQMESEMAKLRQKKRYASNNAAGAMWEQSISTEMQAVSAKYTSMIGVEQSKIEAARSEILSLKGG